MLATVYRMDEGRSAEVETVEMPRLRADCIGDG
jgi:hypothetical protein